MSHALLRSCRLAAMPRSKRLISSINQVGARFYWLMFWMSLCVLHVNIWAVSSLFVYASCMCVCLQMTVLTTWTFRFRAVCMLFDYWFVIHEGSNKQWAADEGFFSSVIVWIRRSSDQLLFYEVLMIILCFSSRVRQVSGGRYQQWHLGTFPQAPDFSVSGTQICLFFRKHTDPQLQDSTPWTVFNLRRWSSAVIQPYGTGFLGTDIALYT